MQRKSTFQKVLRSITLLQQTEKPLNYLYLFSLDKLQEQLVFRLGYGRTKAGKVADGIGENAYPLVAMVNGSLNYSRE